MVSKFGDSRTTRMEINSSPSTVELTIVFHCNRLQFSFAHWRKAGAPKWIRFVVPALLVVLCCQKRGEPKSPERLAKAHGHRKAWA